MTVCPSCGVEFEGARKRSTQANAYYWGVVIAMIATELQETPEDLHGAFKEKFLTREDLILGLRFVGSTAKLSPERFWQYVEQVREWSHAFLGLYIPSPNEGEDLWTVDARRRKAAA